jgi:hypothetical protein
MASQMSLFDSIRKAGPSYVLTDDALHAEALRELKSGTRPDALWATAMADSHMDQRRAATRYVNLRVKSLREEAMQLVGEQKRASEQTQRQQDLQLETQKQQKKTAEQQAREQTKPLQQRFAALWVVVGLALLGLALFIFFVRR